MISDGYIHTYIHIYLRETIHNTTQKKKKIPFTVFDRINSFDRWETAKDLSVIYVSRHPGSHYETKGNRSLHCRNVSALL